MRLIHIGIRHANCVILSRKKGKAFDGIQHPFILNIYCLVIFQVIKVHDI